MVASHENTTLTYTWDTTEAGKYTIKANATLDDDANSGNNELIYGTVTVLLSSTISISASPTTVTLGESTAITGSIDPKRTGVTVTIQYRPAGGSWSELTTVTTDEDSQYAYVWTPTTLGTYELKASWEGDANTSNATSNVIAIEVVEIRDITLDVGGVSFHVVTESNSTISNFELIQADKKISFNVTGPAGTVGYCNVTIPKDLLDATPDQWTVLVDGESTTPLVTDNATHTFIYFTCTLSTRKVEIKGATVATPPIALFTPSTTSSYVNELITFDASASYDDDGDIGSWDWDFDGDGVIDATGEIVEHAYSSAGNYTVTLTVTDDDGLTDIAT
ncbi:MAG: PKD domain-containing protein, partial [Desulfobacterales bacterium]|nr:PKD domain-containing protein [Desulfobacterales bacterium]